MNEWVLCYIVSRKDSDIWCFEDRLESVYDGIEGDLEYAEEESKYTDDLEEKAEYREEAEAIKSDLARIKESLSTAKHRDHLEFGLYEVTVLELPRKFVDEYLERAPDFDGWED